MGAGEDVDERAAERVRYTVESLSSRCAGQGLLPEEYIEGDVFVSRVVPLHDVGGEGVEVGARGAQRVGEGHARVCVWKCRLFFVVLVAPLFVFSDKCSSSPSVGTVRAPLTEGARRSPFPCAAGPRGMYGVNMRECPREL